MKITPVSLLLALSLMVQSAVIGQNTPCVKPPFVYDPAVYIAQARTDSNLKMVELHSLMPRLRYDIRYATTNNFTRQRMYPAGTKTCFLRWPAAVALQRVEARLRTQGLGLKIYDAYRPYSVTVKFWELIKDERYVANPNKGSGHNRGIAIDLTIINLRSGKELDMGTGYDDFTDTAHHNFTNLPTLVLENRKLLRDLMLKEGFVLFETEWWHYSLPDPERYHLLDIPFNSIPKKL